MARDQHPLHELLGLERRQLALAGSQGGAPGFHLAQQLFALAPFQLRLAQRIVGRRVVAQRAQQAVHLFQLGPRLGGKLLARQNRLHLAHAPGLARLPGRGQHIVSTVRIQEVIRAHA